MYKLIVKKVFPGVINQAENEEEKEVVIYGLEVMLSSMVNLAAMLLIGYVSNNLIGTVIYLICFCTIRINAGGYHANNYLACFLCSIISYSFIIGINPYITENYNMILIILAAISYIITLGLAPILNGKRTFSTEEIQKAKKKVRFILTTELFVTIGLYQINYKLYKFAIFAIITEGVFGTMGKIKYWNLNKKSLLKNMMNLSMGVALLTGAGICFALFHEPEMPDCLKNKLENK